MVYEQERAEQYRKEAERLKEEVEYQKIKPENKRKNYTESKRRSKTNLSAGKRGSRPHYKRNE